MAGRGGGGIWGLKPPPPPPPPKKKKKKKGGKKKRERERGGGEREKSGILNIRPSKRHNLQSDEGGFYIYIYGIGRRRSPTLTVDAQTRNVKCLCTLFANGAMTLARMSFRLFSVYESGVIF